MWAKMEQPVEFSGNLGDQDMGRMCVGAFGADEHRSRRTSGDAPIVLKACDLIVAENERKMQRLGAVGAGVDGMAEKALFSAECSIRDRRSSKSDRGGKLDEPDGVGAIPSKEESCILTVLLDDAAKEIQKISQADRVSHFGRVTIGLPILTLLRINGFLLGEMS
jgi:hypothetical protein